MLFVYDIGDVIGLTLVVLTLSLLGLAKVLEAKRVRRARRVEPPKAVPRTHDLTRPTWGHAVVVHKIIDGGERLDVSGHGSGVSQGDYLLLPNKGASARYRVDTVNYQRDPRDMFFADLVFAPREAA